MGMMDELIAAFAVEQTAREVRRLEYEAKRAKNFYNSPAWRKLRYEVLRERGRRCEVCGRSPPDVVIHVDHIKPRSKFPELALQRSNCQIMCADCNIGKMNRDDTDWRSEIQPKVK
jgi:5-methylcytosine-specific restriction endonuclease McrA